jgi:hypothetical protein
VQVGIISTNGEHEIGDLIARGMEKMGVVFMFPSECFFCSLFGVFCDEHELTSMVITHPQTIYKTQM